MPELSSFRGVGPGGRAGDILTGIINGRSPM